MNARLLRKLGALAVMATVAAGAQGALNKLPRDPAVRIDTLPNGLTYYLRHNAEPAGQADFFIVQRVGSINENEDQRGLAHFLEHMCFNGTKHFPGNSLIDYLESIGVKFGANLNAYTSTDETVYNICNVPSGRQTSVDSCLLILRDWSHDLLLTDKDIDEERGVIHGEWRQRQGAANSRMMERAVPRLFAGTPYANRMPIGTMDVVLNFKPETLRDFYRKWYHPSNQAIVVVGDIDLDAAEAKIKQLWADVPRCAPENVVKDFKFPANSEIISVVESDPEHASPNFTLYVKAPALPESDENTIRELCNDLASSLVMSMLAERYDDVEQSPDAPFSNLGIGNMKLLLARTQRALMVRGAAKPSREAEAMNAVSRELQRAVKYGFTQAELDRAKLEERANIDNEFATRNNVTSTDYARKYVRHFLDGGALVSAEQYYKMMKGVMGKVNLDSVNNYIRRVVRPDYSNVMMVAYVPRDGRTTVTEQQLAEAYKDVDPASLEPYVPTVVDKPLLAQMPEAGSIVSEEELPQFGSKVWTLSNGIKVHIKKTDYNPDQLLIQGYSPGGVSQHYNEADASQYRLLNDVLAVSGAGEFSNTDLRRALTGKKLRHDIKIDEMEESMGVNTTPGNLTTALQLIHLKATDLRKDEKALAVMKENRRMRMASTVSNPTYIMGDSIHSNVYNHHPLGMKESIRDIDNLDYDKIMAIYKDRFGDMGDFTFYITGSFDEDSLRTGVCTYLASLPAAGRIEKPKDINYRYAKGRERKDWQCDMEVPQSIVYSLYNVPCDYNLENVVKGNILGTLIRNALRRDLREKRGWTYSVKSHIGLSAGMNGDDPANMIMPVYIRVAPENASATFDIVASTVDGMADVANINTADLNAARTNLLKGHKENRRDNVYWLTVMHMYDKYGQDMDNGWDNMVNSVTAEDLARFAGDYLLKANRIQLQMAPTDKTPKVPDLKDRF